MTNEELKKEFGKWVDEGKKSVWYRSDEDDRWALIAFATWVFEGYYITDDKHAEMRKLQIDELDTKFEVLTEGNWDITLTPAWDVTREYRVKEVRDDI